jgi:hypothetical protein
MELYDSSSPMNRNHRDLNDGTTWQERTRAWNALAWAAQKARSDGDMQNYRLICMQLGINAFYEENFDYAAEQFEESGNPLWAKGVKRYARKLEKEQAKYDEPIFQAKRAEGHYANRFHG